MKAIDFKTCPFCGGVVIIHPDNTSKLFIITHNPTCYMRRFFPGDVSAREGKYVYHLLQEEDIDKWNKRV